MSSLLHAMLGAVACSLLTVPPGRAQVVRGGDLLLPDFNVGSIYRIDAAGAVSTLFSGPMLVGPIGVAVTHRGDVVVADINTGSLVRFGANGGATLLATGLGAALHVVENLDGDFAVTSGLLGAILRVTATGQVSTIAVGPPLVHPWKLALDRNGDYLVADDAAGALFRVTPAGVVTPIHSGFPLQVPGGIALFPDGDYAVGDVSARTVLRIDRATGAVSTFCPATALGGSPVGLAADFGGGLVAALAVGPGVAQVVAIDATGAVRTIAGSGAVVGPQDVVRVPFVVGPRTLTSGPGSNYAFAVDVPFAAGRFYSLVLSASVFPGWPLPGTSQSLAVNADAFFYATIGQDSPPLRSGWNAFLDANGRATATTDLSLLPVGALRGLVLYQQGVTLASSTQFGIALNLRRLEFR